MVLTSPEIRKTTVSVAEVELNDGAASDAEVIDPIRLEMAWRVRGEVDALNFTITSPGMKVGPLRGPTNLDCARPHAARPRTMLAEVKNLNCMELTYSATLRNSNIVHPKAGT